MRRTEGRAARREGAGSELKPECEGENRGKEEGIEFRWREGDWYPRWYVCVREEERINTLTFA